MNLISTNKTLIYIQTYKKNIIRLFTSTRDLWDTSLTLETFPAINKPELGYDYPLLTFNNKRTTDLQLI